MRNRQRFAMSEILESDESWRKIERRETIRESRNYLYETIEDTIRKKYYVKFTSIQRWDKQRRIISSVWFSVLLWIDFFMQTAYSSTIRIFRGLQENYHSYDNGGNTGPAICSLDISILSLADGACYLQEYTYVTLERHVMTSQGLK